MTNVSIRGEEEEEEEEEDRYKTIQAYEFLFKLKGNMAHHMNLQKCIMLINTKYLSRVCEILTEKNISIYLTRGDQETQLETAELFWCRNRKSRFLLSNLKVLINVVSTVNTTSPTDFSVYGANKLRDDAVGIPLERVIVARTQVIVTLCHKLKTMVHGLLDVQVRTKSL